METSPAFSPDGRWIALTVSEAGSSVVYVWPFPSTGAGHRISAERGLSPLWDPRGSALYYIAEGQVMTVRVDTASTFRAERPRPLFDAVARGVSFLSGISADGQRFLAIQRPADTPPRLLVVTPWFDELRRTMRAAGQ